MRVSSSPSLSWFHASAEVKALLMAAADSWQDTARSRRYVEQAIALGQDNPDVLIAAYRYFFYKNESELALWVAQLVMGEVHAQRTYLKDGKTYTRFCTSAKRNRSSVSIFMPMLPLGSY